MNALKPYVPNVGMRGSLRKGSVLFPWFSGKSKTFESWSNNILQLKRIWPKLNSQGGKFLKIEINVRGVQESYIKQRGF